MKNLINSLMVLALSVSISACGGGGGGGGGGGNPTPPTGGGTTGCTDSAATNYNAAATTDDGSCTYAGNGSAAYYAISTNSATSPAEAVAVPGTAHEVSNQFYVDVVTENSGVLEVGVYQPTCLNGGSYKDYALVLLGGTGVSMVSVRVLSTGVTLETLSYDNNLTQKKKVSASSLSGTCSNGKMTLTNGSVIFSNGNAIVYRDASNNLYAGLSSTVSYNPTTQVGTDVSSENGGGTEVLTNNYTYYASGQPLLGLAAQGSAGGYEDDGSFFGTYNGVAETAVGDGDASLVLNGSVDVASYHSVVKGRAAYASRELRSVAGSINGKNVLLGTMSDSCATDTGAYTTCSGVDMIYTSVEQ